MAYRANHLKIAHGYLALTAALLLTLFAILTAALTYLFATETTATTYLLSFHRAYYAAKAGLEYGQWTLQHSPSYTHCQSLNEQLSLKGATVTVRTAQSNSLISTTTSLISMSAREIMVENSNQLAPKGRIYIDKEAIDYQHNDTAHNKLLVLHRGAAKTKIANHAPGTIVSQNQCAIESVGLSPGNPIYGRAILQQTLPLATVVTSGQQGTLLQWGPSEKWQSMQGNSNDTTFNAIDIINSHQGWAVGNKMQGRFSINRLNEGVWSSLLLKSSASVDLYGISAVSSQQAWAVGERRGNRFTLLQWQGGSATNWCLVGTTPSCGGVAIQSSASTNEKDLFAIQVIDTDGDGLGDFGFAVGGRKGTQPNRPSNRSTILFFEGGHWRDSAIIDNQEIGQLYGLSIVSNGQTTPIEAFAVGRSSRYSKRGVIIRWRAEEDMWQPVTTSIHCPLRAIAMIDTDNDGHADYGWAVGDDGCAYEYKAGQWHSLSLFSVDLYAVKVLSTSDAWIVGDKGSRYHWDGSTWTPLTTGYTTNKPLFGLAVAGVNG